MARVKSEGANGRNSEGALEERHRPGPRQGHGLLVRSRFAIRHAPAVKRIGIDFDFGTDLGRLEGGSQLILDVGLATVVPIAFRAAGSVPGIPTGIGIAGITTVGYAGFLVGPPLIGFAAEATSLRAALLIVVGLLLCLAALAQATRPAGTAA